jgi:glycosyltransferase involved in cell wall biosynthesis
VNPTVSVILPVRDGGDYLAAAVDSILAQTMDDLELLVVDDHSSDGAVGQLNREDSRVSLLFNDGSGVSKAFNTGLGSARGRFIARMDADDLALPTRLERQLGYLETHPEIGIAGACVEIFSTAGIAGGNRRYQRWLNACRTPGQIHRELFIESPIPNPTALFRAEVIQQLGGYGDPPWPEDYDLFLKADARGIRMGKPEEVLLRWREHPDRLTRTDERYRLERFQAAKAEYLVQYRLQGKGPVAIWGAGPSGRLMHDLLTATGCEVSGFLEVHPRRIGGEKRGLPVWPIERAGERPDQFILVAVGAAGARENIRGFMRRCGRQEGRDYLFVA